MPELNLNAISIGDPRWRVYVYSTSDLPGVAAANTYLAFQNPSNSTRLHLGLSLTVNCYAVGTTTVSASMQAFHTSGAFTGGSQVTNSQIGRFVSTFPDPLSTFFTGNPTVTTTSPLPIGQWPPAIATGPGVSNALSAPPPGASFLLAPGEGVSFATTSGNTNQRWSFTYIWAEFGIDTIAK